MKIINYKITTLAPVIIPDEGNDPNMVFTKDFIPGNVLLGVFASKYIKQTGKHKDVHRDNTFFDWFLSGKLIYSNGTITDPSDNAYYPAPNSINYQKHREADIYESFALDEKKLLDMSLKSLNTYVSIDNESIKKLSVKKGIDFHHERDPETGTTKPGMIYNYQSIEKKQAFAGKISGEPEDIDQFYEMFGPNMKAYIGRSKNSQYGKVNIEFEKPAAFQVEKGRPSEEVVLTFLSDAIIYNDNCFPSLNILDLQKFLPGSEIQDSYIKSQRNEQFVSIWKLKNQSERCFKAGSCFKLSQLPENAGEILQHGLGERTHEGFGQVSFTFQNPYAESYEILPDQNRISQPVAEIPPVLKTIMRDTIHEHITNRVLEKVIDDVKGFRENRPISKSLCGKLELFCSNEMKSISGFIGYIKDLKNISRTNMSKCHNKQTTLLDHMEHIQSLSLEQLRLPAKTEELKELISFKIDEELKQKLYKIYLVKFFNLLRKRRDTK